MMVSKTLLLFLLFFIYKTDEFFFRRHKYYVGLGGHLNCSYTNRGHVDVFLTSRPLFFYEKHPLDKRRVRYGDKFYLSGIFKKRRHPKLYLKFIHNCVKSNFYGKRKTAIMRVITFRVPDQYIGKNNWPNSLYFMGKIDLARLNKNE